MASLCPVCGSEFSAYEALPVRSRRYLSSGEVDRISYAVDRMETSYGRPLPGRDGYALMVLLMFQCGLRMGEVLALRAGSIDLDELQVHVVESLNEVRGRSPVIGPPEHGLRRSVPIPMSLLPRLSWLMEEFGDQELVFTNSRGRVLNRGWWGKRVWQTACLEAGIEEDLRISSLRHSYAARMAESGCSAESLSVLMGASSSRNIRGTYRDLFPKGAPRKYCSDRCRNKSNRNNTTKKCSRESCERFVRAKGLCSMHYNSTFHKGIQRKYDDPEKKRLRDRKRTQWRRAIMSDPEAERIDRDVVGERDGWSCWICRLDVDNSLAWPDPKSPSLDHVLPLSKGGKHTYSNVRITHLTCNVRRGSRIEVPSSSTASSG